MSEIGEAHREGFEAIMEVMGQTIVVHENFKTLESNSYEVKGIKNTEGKNSKTVIFQFPEQLNISIGNVLQIKGSRDYWKVTDTEDIVEDETFINFETHVEKIDISGQSTRPSRNLGNTYNLHGTHARVNVSSNDNSINISHQNTENVFADMRQVIQNQIQNESERTEILSKLSELEQSVGKKEFLAKYQEFIGTSADHISLIAVFIPYLTQLLGA
jgi:hypothetical protein